MYSYAILGLGPAGLLALAHLPDEALRSTIAFEPACIGGDLAAAYGTIRANIPKSVIRRALQSIPRWAEARLTLLDAYGEEECPRLSDAVKQIRVLAADLLRQIELHSIRVDGLEQLTGGDWRLHTCSGAHYDTKKLLLCTGARPKTLDLPIPAIPLSIALNATALSDYVVPATDRVVVFGTAHSGTLVLKHLKDAGVREVTAVYKGDRPFRYFRDGDSEGIKQESERIADEIVGRVWGDMTPRLVQFDAIGDTYRALHRATHVVYALGFETPCWKYKAADGSEKVLQHRADTSMFDAPNVWGFGIGYPTRYTAPNGVQYPDIGFGPFADAVRAALPHLLTPS
jgi:hypothetical protein